MQVSALQIATLISGKVIGDPDVVVDGPCKIEEGQIGKISFLSNPKYAPYIYETKASIVLVGNDFTPENPVKTTLISVENVYVALASLMSNFSQGISIPPNISAKASIDPDTEIGEQTYIDDHVIIRKGARIGKNCRIYGQVFIGDDAKIGDNVTLYPGVKIYHQCIIGSHVTIHANVVIGSDGFGFAPNSNGQFNKIDQVGNVIIHDHVEIGANTVIDRATMGSTVIGKGSKLDNLIQIAHNVSVGENTVIAAQTGIAGSTKIGDNCMLGGQVGMAGHITIANGTMIQAQSGIASSIKEENTKWYGSPAIDYQNYLRSYAQFKNLSVLAKQLKEMKKEIEILKSNK